MSGRARKISAVPRTVLALVAAGLLAQVGWHAVRPAPGAHATSLPPPPGLAMLRVASLGDPLVMARLLMLWLQAHDNQPGVSIPFRNLDYERVEAWLERILDLDPRSQYPLLAASRVYAGVSDPARKRLMLDLVHRRFLEDPDRRWPWLAHAAIVAKHSLHDDALALTYARAITDHATGPEVPRWARDMAVVILEDMGELEAATVLVGHLLASQEDMAPHERRFLVQKLEELEAKAQGGQEGAAER
ncbi:MAG: hypothetical protein R3286_19210 [Gammaproteobacteria bacterium]|nr:hypothetical protein [Gammaproteobacteria bacterium]